MFCSRCGTQIENTAKFCPSCGLDLAANTPLGRLSDAPSAESEIDLVRDALQHEYRVLEELGRGGMAIVFRAMDRQLEREVAVKVLPFSLAFDQEFVERFQREARTAARLEHPHIIPIYRVGKLGRVIFFVMKFLRGESLSEELEKHGRLPADRIRKQLIQTAGALGYAHKHGIVHRDIKPDNIMFDEMGHAIVTDFGIAKAASGTRLTGTGMSIGTPHYMSPEQARAQSLDGRSDIYSLGVVAYQSLAGKVPFDGEDAFAIGYKHIMEDLPAPPLAGADDRQLFRIIQRMMAKSPDERFQTAEQLVEVLEGRASVSLPITAETAPPPVEAATVSLPSIAGETASRRPVRPSAADTDRRPSTPTTPMPRVQPAPRRKKRGGALVFTSLVLLLAGGGAGGWYYYTNVLQRPAAPAAPAAPVVDSAALAAAAARADSLRLDSLRAESLAALAALPDSGTLVLTGVPAGARWRLDGEVRQPTDTVVQVVPRNYAIEVAATGFQTFRTTAPVGRGETVRIQVAMQAAQAAPGIPAPGPPARQADCTNPVSELYNLNGGCFDRAPRFNTSPLVPLEASVLTERPTPTILWVLVSPAGRALRVQPKQMSNDAAFTRLAVQYARDGEYLPAQKDGRAVEAWFQLQLVAGQRR